MLKIANKDFKVTFIAMLNDIIENMLEVSEEIIILSRKKKLQRTKWKLQS